MKITLIAIVLMTLVIPVAAHGEDLSGAGEIVELGDCLGALDVGAVQVGSYRAQKFGRPLRSGEYDAFASLAVRNIWYGYGEVSPRGYEAIDWPGGRVQMVYEWLNARSRVSGEWMTIRVVWSDATPFEYYILPMKRDGHGGGGCRFYSVSVSEFWEAMDQYDD